MVPMLHGFSMPLRPSTPLVKLDGGKRGKSKRRAASKRARAARRANR